MADGVGSIGAPSEQQERLKAVETEVAGLRAMMGELVGAVTAMQQEMAGLTRALLPPQPQPA